VRFIEEAIEKSVAELAFQLVDTPLKPVDSRRELGRIEVGTADGIPGIHLRGTDRDAK